MSATIGPTHTVIHCSVDRLLSRYCIDNGSYQGWRPPGLPGPAAPDDLEEDEIVTESLRRLHTIGRPDPWKTTGGEPDIMQVMFEELEWRVEV